MLTEKPAALAFTLVSAPLPATASVHPSLGVPKDIKLETTVDAVAVTELAPSRPRVEGRVPGVVRPAQDRGAEATREARRA